MSDDHISAQEFGEMKGKVTGLCREIGNMRIEMRDGFKSIEAKLPTQCDVHSQQIKEADEKAGEAEEAAVKAHRRLDKMLGNILKIIIPIFLAMAGGLFYLAMYLNGGGTP